MAKPVIEVKGLRELSRELRRVDKQMPKRLRAAATEAAKVAVPDVKRGVR